MATEDVSPSLAKKSATAPRQAAVALIADAILAPRFLTRRYSIGSTRRGTDREVATSTKPP